jgi:hypothetical protein
MFQNCTSNKGIVKGLWFDGEWLDKSWVPSSNGVPGHWREGVNIERSWVNGTLTSVSAYINGTWVDGTDRVRLLEKDSIMPMSELAVMTELIARGEIRFFNPRSWQPGDEMGGYSVTNVNLNEGFNNRWETEQSRLIMFSGILPISARSLPEVVERLNSNITIVSVQADTELQDSNFNGVHTNTHDVPIVYDRISLTTLNNSRIYNAVLDSNQTFNLDSYGVEAFIEPRN